MHGRTRNTLLGIGFDTDLIAAIDRQHHTVDALRSLSAAALRQSYSEVHAKLIEARVKRAPIPDDVVARILSASGECCCYCADGVSSKPYQIHHIEPYAATQSHAEDNLLVVCPTHHVVVHERKLSTAEQKRVRREWHAQVELAEAYRARGVSFSFERFTPIDFAGDPDAGELVRDFRVTPATALGVSRHEVAAECRTLLLEERRAVIIGRSGDGKSTLALGVAGLLHAEGWRVFRYRPPARDSRTAVHEVLECLGVAVRKSVIILDDVNLWATVEDLECLIGAVGENVGIIATWTQDTMSDDPRLKLRLPRWVLLSWERIASAVSSFLRSHEGTVVSALQCLGKGGEHARIGLGFLDARLHDRINRYEARAKTVSEFLFLLRGGADAVEKELASLVDEGRADVPVLYAATEQIADFERHVSPEETATACARLGVPEGQPRATATWVREVFEAQCTHRRMQRSRSAYTTIHRDWARQLICAALGGERTRSVATALLARDFDLLTQRPRRLAVLWSWLIDDPHGTPFVREWAARQKAEDWGVLVGTAARAGLEDVSVLASQMHIFIRSDEWDRTVGAAFSEHSELLAEKVSGATPKDWFALRSLFMNMVHACPDVISSVIEVWEPSAAAATLSATHPDYYHSASWFFSVAAKHSRAWCDAVGQNIHWDQVSQNLGDIRSGDLDTVSECCSLLLRLRVPMHRSMIRRYAEVMRQAVIGASLHDLRPGFGGDLAIFLQLFPDEVEGLASALDRPRLARELSDAPPRYWRVLLELAIFLRTARSEAYEDIIRLLDRDKFVATVSEYGPLHPYELRCLVWLLSNGSNQARTEFALALYDTVATACRASREEQSQILAAFSHLDEPLAEKLAAQLNTPIRKKKIDERPLHERSTIWRTTREQIRELDAAGGDYTLEFVENALDVFVAIEKEDEDDEEAVSGA